MKLSILVTGLILVIIGGFLAGYQANLFVAGSTGNIVSIGATTPVCVAPGIPIGFIAYDRNGGTPVVGIVITFREDTGSGAGLQNVTTNAQGAATMSRVFPNLGNHTIFATDPTGAVSGTVPIFISTSCSPTTTSSSVSTTTATSTVTVTQTTTVNGAGTTVTTTLTGIVTTVTRLGTVTTTVNGLATTVTVLSTITTTVGGGIVSLPANLGLIIFVIGLITSIAGFLIPGGRKLR